MNRFPLLGTKGETIPWGLAEKAYVVYCEKYGGSGQSLKRVAERGGFAPSEMDMFLPTWRDELQDGV